MNPEIISAVHSACFTPPSGRPPCTGNFTFTAAEQAASGAATLEHYDAVLGSMAAQVYMDPAVLALRLLFTLASMAAQNKGTVMSMNPVTATSAPINSSQSDAVLLKHKAFRFWEFFGDSGTSPFFCRVCGFLD